jgi:uncharacterized protein
MLEQARIDGLKFAREGGRLTGEVAVADMGRLRDMLFEQSGSVHYVLVGALDEHGRPTLNVEVRGTVPLLCQRCLERLDFELLRTAHLILVADDAELPDVSREALDSETIRAADLSDVSDLVEQETVLGLPLAPVHEQACSTAQSPARPQDDSPFAVLKRLRHSDA